MCDFLPSRQRSFFVLVARFDYGRHHALPHTTSSLASDGRSRGRHYIGGELASHFNPNNLVPVSMKNGRETSEVLRPWTIGQTHRCYRMDVGGDFLGAEWEWVGFTSHVQVVKATRAQGELAVSGAVFERTQWWGYSTSY